MYKISVIIPVHNAENTLKKAINSILNQKWNGDFTKDVEIIPVDDYSSDNSKNILIELSEKYKNIKPIFLKTNSGGPSKPRNIGIENATGEYLLFLDSDDKFVEDAFLTLYKIMEKEKVDIIHFNHYDLINNELFKFKNTENNKEYIYIKGDEKLFLRGTVWGNLFKRSFIIENKIKFLDTLHEDGIFAIECYILGTIIKMSYYGYIYSISSESITHKVDINTLKKYFNGMKLLNNVLKKYKLKKLESKLMSSANIQFYFMFLKVKTSKAEKISILKEFKEFNDIITGEVILESKIMEIINKLVKEEKYSLAVYASNIIGLVYKNQKIKDFIFKYYSNLEKIKE